MGANNRKRVSDKRRQKIVADYIETENYSEVARRNNVSDKTVAKVISETPDIVEKLEEKKKENTKDILQYMEDKKYDVQRVLNKLLRGIEVKAEDINIEKTDLKSLATAYGIVLDKQLKLVELLRGVANNEQLDKVKELLDKLDNEAKQ